MKALGIVIALIIIAALYGWRFHPERIGTKAPVITRETGKNQVANWNPAGFLDRFNGNREYQREQAKIQADRAALEDQKNY